MNMNTKNADLSRFNHHIIDQISEHIIFKFDLSEIDPDAVAANLRPLLQGRIRRNAANATRKGFYVTDTEIFTPESNHQFDDLIQAIEKRVEDIVRSTNTHVLEKLVNVKPKVSTFWGAWYQKGDLSGWHVHQDIYAYQAVYYPVVDDDSPIIFKNDSNGKNLEIRPNKGSLVVFSGKTNHMVPELTTDKTRLVFASNLVLKEVE